MYYCLVVVPFLSRFRCGFDFLVTLFLAIVSVLTIAPFAVFLIMVLVAVLIAFLIMVLIVFLIACMSLRMAMTKTIGRKTDYKR